MTTEKSKFYQNWVAFIPYHLINPQARAVDSAYSWLNRTTGEIVTLSANDWLVYAYIFECCQASFINRANKAGGFVEPDYSVCGDTNAWIAERIKLSPSTVKKAVNHLTEAGIVIKTNHRTKKEDGTFEQHRHLRPANLDEWLTTGVIRQMKFRPHKTSNRTSNDSYDYRSYKEYQETVLLGLTN